MVSLIESTEILLEGTNTYEFQIDNNGYIDDNYFENLPPGVYTIRYREKGGCHPAILKNITVFRS